MYSNCIADVQWKGSFPRPFSYGTSMSATGHLWEDLRIIMNNIVYFTIIIYIEPDVTKVTGVMHIYSV